VHVVMFSCRSRTGKLAARRHSQPADSKHLSLSRVRRWWCDHRHHYHHLTCARSRCNRCSLVPCTTSYNSTVHMRWSYTLTVPALFTAGHWVTWRSSRKF